MLYSFFRSRPDQDDFPVKLPEGYLEWVRHCKRAWDSDTEHDFQIEPWCWDYKQTDRIFPPVGFIPLSDFTDGDIGNGDDFGLYWPVGREDRLPVIARSSHDCGTITPFASTLETASRLSSLEALPPERLVDPKHRIRSIGSAGKPWDEDQLRERLEIDPDSPYLLVANADVHLAAGDLDIAEQLYLRSIENIPEYTAAQIGLVELHKRAGHPRDQCAWTLEALRSPPSLHGPSAWAEDQLRSERLDRSGYRPRLFESLRRMKADEVGDLAMDPLFEARHELQGTLKPRTKTEYKTEDYRIYREIIQRLIADGKPVQAVLLAMTHGELLDSERSGFVHAQSVTYRKGQENLAEFYRDQGFSEASHRTMLGETFRAAGLTRREKLLKVAPRGESDKHP